MIKRNGTYLLAPRSASQILICRFARRRRLTVDDAVLRRVQLALELRQHRLSIVRDKKRSSSA
jgi:hypothetical protein